MRSRISDLNKVEDNLINRFYRAVLGIVEPLDEESFKEMLLQRRIFATRTFTPAYDEVIASTTNSEVKEILKEIRQEEYPKESPDHREDFVYDLERIGLSRSEIGSTKISPQTRSATTTLLETISYHPADSQNTYAIRALSGIRMGFEITVAEAYKIIMEGLTRRFEMQPKDSKFFFPHYEHDLKTTPLGQEGLSHSDRLGSILADLINSDKDQLTAVTTLQDSANAVLSFYEQYI